MKKQVNSFVGLIDRPKMYSRDFIDNVTCDLEEMPKKFKSFVSGLNYFDVCLEESCFKAHIFSEYCCCGNRFYVDVLLDYYLFNTQSLIDLAFEISHLKREFVSMYPDSKVDILLDSYVSGSGYDLKLSFNFTVDYDF